MTSDEIIKLAREAGLMAWNGDCVLTDGQLERFFFLAAAAGAAAEREACADKTGEFARKWWSLHCASNKHLETTRKAHDDFCALQAAIRARGQK